MLINQEAHLLQKIRAIPLILARNFSHTVEKVSMTGLLNRPVCSSNVLLFGCWYGSAFWLTVKFAPFKFSYLLKGLKGCVSELFMGNPSRSCLLTYLMRTCIVFLHLQVFDRNPNRNFWIRLIRYYFVRPIYALQCSLLCTVGIVCSVYFVSCLPPPKEGCNAVICVRLFVCPRDFSKSNEQILVPFLEGWGVALAQP